MISEAATVGREGCGYRVPLRFQNLLRLAGPVRSNPPHAPGLQREDEVLSIGGPDWIEVPRRRAEGKARHGIAFQIVDEDVAVVRNR
jgi:hypothetical protein